MEHINLLKNRGVSCNKVIVNPEHGLISLKNKISGVEVDAVGAREHLHLAGIQI